MEVRLEKEAGRGIQMNEKREDIEACRDEGGH